MKNLVANAEITVHAPVAKVWDALVNPTIIKQYMMGATVSSKWKKGSEITWKGEFNGSKYEDRGEILNLEPEKELQYSHYSPLSGLEDSPENYHTVTIHLFGDNNKTNVYLSQDKNATEEEKVESEKNWGTMLNGLKMIMEGKNP